ncbi:BOLA2-SMG1P6 isoform 2 [Pongo abelii]|uniref:BOLA2-SMG1P6 isoform 1 n=1 Tax=Pongo abelii TaxID=9601 RepID=A0A2J8TK25_PONAB|nr:BOLA2-SMG1P6 isoform 1 [Pongo abelii]PNJ33324.1 BOLA2-SMG1P6 isoform 2 [Pongo abelii]
MASAKSLDRWKARLPEGGSTALTYALVRAEVSFPAEVAPVRQQGSAAAVRGGCVPVGLPSQLDYRHGTQRRIPPGEAAAGPGGGACGGGGHDPQPLRL